MVTVLPTSRHGLHVTRDVDNRLPAHCTLPALVCASRTIDALLVERGPADLALAHVRVRLVPCRPAVLQEHVLADLATAGLPVLSAVPSTVTPHIRVGLPRGRKPGTGVGR